MAAARLPADNLPMLRLLAGLAVAAALLAGCGLSSDVSTPAGTSGTPETVSTVPTAVVRVVEKVDATRYWVEGRTAGDVRAYMNANGPTSLSDDRRYDAVTNWNLRWSFRYRGDSPCAISAATVEVEVLTILPTLQMDGLPSDLITRWGRYLQALSAHEKTHVEKAVGAARDLKAALEHAPAAPTCDELAGALNTLGEEHVQRLRAADNEYDVATAHGRNEGAVFP